MKFYHPIDHIGKISVDRLVTFMEWCSQGDTQSMVRLHAINSPASAYIDFAIGEDTPVRLNVVECFRSYVITGRDWRIELHLISELDMPYCSLRSGQYPSTISIAREGARLYGVNMTMLFGTLCVATEKTKIMKLCNFERDMVLWMLLGGEHAETNPTSTHMPKLLGMS
jgi:hypothetical protein